MKHNIISLWLGLLSIAFLVGCSSSSDMTSPEEEDVTYYTPYGFTSAENSTIRAAEPFAFSLLKECAAQSDDKNIVISPLSVQMCLAMVANGATGETLDEILAALGVDTDGLANLNTYAKRLTEGMDAACPSGLTMMSQALFYDYSNFNVSDSFKADLDEFFGAPAFAIGAGSAQSEIDDWVRQSTNGLINASDLDDTLDGAAFAILNSVCFGEKWLVPFEADQIITDTFTSEDGTVSQVEYLSDKRTCMIGLSESFLSVTLSFTNCPYRITFVLPDEEYDIQQGLEMIDSNVWNDLLWSVTKTYYVDIRIPKFEFKQTNSLIHPLKNIGIVKAFNSGAEFGKMSSTPTFLGNFSQGCTMSIDENGVTATTATSAEGLFGAPEISDGGSIWLDRPFLFAITDVTSPSILFMGKVGKL